MLSIHLGVCNNLMETKKKCLISISMKICIFVRTVRMNGKSSLIIVANLDALVFPKIFSCKLRHLNTF